MAPRLRLWVPTLVLIFELSLATSVHSAQYVVDGFVLGGPVASDSANYRTYSCAPSDQFDDAVRCKRQERKTTSTGTVNVASEIVHAQDGTLLSGTVDATPVNITESVVIKEIMELTKTIGVAPTAIVPLPGNSPISTSVIVSWGQVKLDLINDYDALDALQNGVDPGLGMLADSLGDPQLSAQKFLPVYRVIGGAGYIYSASFELAGKGRRHYVAVNPTELAPRRFGSALRAILRKDQSLAEDDYHRWPDIAFLTRRFALDTSVEVADKALDEIFDGTTSSKFDSRVWSILPLGTIKRLSLGRYWRHDVYAPNTKFPAIRRDVELFLSRRPNDRFVEFAYFLLGEYDAALAANPKAIGDVLNYAAGYKTIISFARDLLDIAKAHDLVEKSMSIDADRDDWEAYYSVNDVIALVNTNPNHYRYVNDLIPNFSDRAAEARTHFEKVLRDKSSRLADDAAYMIGWLELRRGNIRESLAHFSQVLEISTTANIDDEYYSALDYRAAALKEAVRIVEKMPSYEQIEAVEGSKIFEQEPALWYAAARAAYRDFDYALAMTIGERGLKAINVPIDRLPVTTDPDRISAALQDIDPKLVYNGNIREMPYLIEASREMLGYERKLNNITLEDPESFARSSRAIIEKYSLLLDLPEESDQAPSSSPLQHRDLRQALHMINETLRQTRRVANFGSLREWLYYRKVRVQAVHAPKEVPDCVEEMRREFPSSQLLDDALAEQMFAEGLMLGDVGAARRTFEELLMDFPAGNSVDNGYSWMAITLRRAGQTKEAEAIDREIIRLFPLTRHATYARERIANPY